ncbi:transcriptional regulator [Salmonella enterica subsp. enterica serovar Enteritidis str. SA19940857]|nr:transcriptional regulator [Salmonella enterica subsp. enterica serovar Enteritidis str. SA19940857]
MSKRLPPLNALRVFDAAARHLSFTRAAEELFVTQAAVSHQIKSLEDFLGLKTRKLQARSAKGALTVSLPPSFAIQWLVPRLSSFNSAYPGIDVRIQAVDRQEDKLADDVDVAIFYGRGNWPGLRVEKLYAEYLQGEWNNVALAFALLCIHSTKTLCLYCCVSHSILIGSEAFACGRFWSPDRKIR